MDAIKANQRRSSKSRSKAAITPAAPRAVSGHMPLSLCAAHLQWLDSLRSGSYCKHSTQWHNALCGFN
jgi:hypothetical protein